MGKSQNLKLFKRGNLISGAPNIKGNIQLPKPPIIVGITIKKIINKAWAVIIELYNWPSPIKKPGLANSKRIICDKLVPTIPDHKPKTKYNVPISLWLELSNQYIKPCWYFLLNENPGTYKTISFSIK